MTYSNPKNVPAVRAHTRENPTTCPWCGEGKWFVSAGDDGRDNGRVQMYCDSPDCHSRETELIVVRGEGAHERADVRALQAVDSGRHASDGDPLVDLDAHRSAASLVDLAEYVGAHRVEWRHSGASFAVVPSASDG